MSKALIIAAMLLSPDVTALVGFLERSEVSGTNRYCHYTDGKIITVNIMSQCPMRA